MRLLHIRAGAGTAWQRLAPVLAATMLFVLVTDAAASRQPAPQHSFVGDSQSPGQPTFEPPPGNTPVPIGPTDQPATAPATDVPTAAATSIPVPTEPLVPEPRQRQGEPQQPPPQDDATPATPGLPATPVRTQRPTRTPRGGTPTATPPTTAALRLTLYSEPPSPAVGQPATLVVELRNGTGSAVGGLLVEIVPPDQFQVEALEPVTGLVTRDGAVIRWVIPELSGAGVTRLVLRGSVLRSAAGRMSLCASLLSAGAPLEHCISLEPAQDTLDVPADGASSFEAAATAAAGALVEGPFPERTADELVRWAVLIAGFAALGLWGGLMLRRRG